VAAFFEAATSRGKEFSARVTNRVHTGTMHSVRSHIYVNNVAEQRFFSTAIFSDVNKTTKFKTKTKTKNNQDQDCGRKKPISKPR